MSQIVLVSGPSGAGKSAVCESLCERYDRTVHVETDVFYAWIRMGYQRPWLPGSDRQNRMVSRAVARAATAYAQDLYAVFIDGVIGPHLLPLYVEELAAAAVPVHFALLMPSLEVTIERAGGRDGAHNMPDAPHRDLYRQFEAWGDFAGVTIDTATLTPDQAGDRVMEACGRGDALVWSPAIAS
jgi:2-phosphoglycerate kinase